MRTIALAVCVLSLFGLGLSQTRQVEFQPFSATIRSQYWTESGKSYESSVIFRRTKDGSFNYTDDVEYPLEQDKAKRERFSYRLDVQRRLYTLTEPFVHAAVVRPIVDDAEMQQLIDAYGSCKYLEDGTWREVGHSTVLNFDVVEVEVERTNRSLEKKWIAPDLQCFALRESSMIDGQLRMRKEVVSIEMNDQPRSMFEPPAGYTRMSPLELESHYRAKFPGKEFFGRSVYNMEDRHQRAVSEMRAREQRSQ